jgi:putative SOS response-associated peptidase YedK
VTTDANDLLAVIHNSKKRMPVILDRDAEKRWISSDTSPEEAFSLLKPCSTDLIKAHTISNLINNKSANRNTPELIRPYPRQNNSLFG